MVSAVFCRMTAAALLVMAGAADRITAAVLSSMAADAVDGISDAVIGVVKALHADVWAGLALNALLLWLVVKAMCGKVLTFLAEHGVTRANYRGDVVPTGAGLLLWLAMLADLALAAFWRAVDADQALSAIWQAVQADPAVSAPRPDAWKEAWEALAPGPETAGLFAFSEISLLRFALPATVVFFAGWLDDTVGNRIVKGFRGHLQAWLREGRITTGLMKAGAICAAAAWASWNMGGHAAEWVVRTLVIALTANALNLLDLRPGRALKGFFLFGAVLVSVSWMAGHTAESSAAAWRCIMPLAAAAAVLFRYDVRSKAMLGDTGANLLGFALGYAAASVCPLPIQAGLLALLAWLHWIAERRSISGLIEGNAALSWLDRLGRRG